jgi:hypothetical protein
LDCLELAPGSGCAYSQDSYCANSTMSSSYKKRHVEGIAISDLLNSLSRTLDRNKTSMNDFMDMYNAVAQGINERLKYIEDELEVEEIEDKLENLYYRALELEDVKQFTGINTDEYIAEQDALTFYPLSRESEHKRGFDHMTFEELEVYVQGIEQVDPSEGYYGSERDAVKEYYFRKTKEVIIKKQQNIVVLKPPKQEVKEEKKDLEECTLEELEEIVNILPMTKRTIEALKELKARKPQEVAVLQRAEPEEREVLIETPIWEEVVVANASTLIEPKTAHIEKPPELEAGCWFEGNALPMEYCLKLSAVHGSEKRKFLKQSIEKNLKLRSLRGHVKALEWDIDCGRKARIKMENALKEKRVDDFLKPFKEKKIHKSEGLVKKRYYYDLYRMCSLHAA